MHATHHDDQGTRPAPSKGWEALIIARGYTALIFDCDGTLVDSSHAHFNAFRDAARAQGANLDPDWYAARTGLDRRSLLSAFADTTGDRFDVDRAIADSIAAFDRHLHLVRSVPETAGLVARFVNAMPMAVGTNAEAQVARASLTAVGLAASFPVISSISDGHRPKPAPDIYSAAAGHLGHPPHTTLVIEDSNEGVRAARAAGMDVLHLAPATTSE